MEVPPLAEWHSKQVEEIFNLLKSGPEGLSSLEASLRLKRFGPNELRQEEKASPFKILLRQFTSVLMIILIAATLVSALVGEIVDAVTILAILIASAFLGFFQEYRAEKALEALKKMLSPTITVLRDGKEVEVPSRELVPGDVMILEAGDKIPADGRLTAAVNLQVDESALTGESTPVEKKLETLSPSTYVADRANMVFSGTIVTYGKGKAVVTETGMLTEFGKIARDVLKIRKEETPLEKRMTHVGRWLGALCLAVCFIVVGFGVVREYLLEGGVGVAFLLEMVLFGVALAVAAVPEALPAIVTGALAISMREMAKNKALVRKMPAVETLGCVTVICSDKTGTLTKGEMTVREIYLPHKTIHVTGAGYEPTGLLLYDGKEVEDERIPLLSDAAILCNDARLELQDGSWRVIGDPTEGALLTLAVKAGRRVEEVRAKHPRVGEVPFSSERKMMTTIHVASEGPIAYVKGAPEVVLARSTRIRREGEVTPMSEAERRGILKVNEEMAERALRVLAFAYRPLNGFKVDGEVRGEQVERDLTFLGLVGMIDPPRPEAVEAAKTAHKVGIKTIMITGDHKLTAVSVARELGIYKEGDLALTGEELEEMRDEEFEAQVERVTVYARVSPIHKLKIVNAWKKRGEVVAVTGDGVNDAPAIKSADVGIAMGITGTEVTKEASDLVLTDDNFATIVKAVEKGRWIYDNIKKYLTYLLQCNLVEILVIGGGVLLGLPLPLLPAQILWVNLTTDGLPALALGVSPADPDIMERPPRNPRESIFTREVKAMLTAIPIILSPILLSAFVKDLALSLEEARTTLFLVFVFFELVIALNCRSLTHSIFKSRPHRFLWFSIIASAALTLCVLELPSVRDAFGVTIPTSGDIALAAILSLTPLALLEFLKLGLKRGNRNRKRKYAPANRYSGFE
ncbi:MAG: cation-translocating P-type ATPase [Candidatus Bathyarchaeia archaeon]